MSEVYLFLTESFKYLNQDHLSIANIVLKSVNTSVLTKIKQGHLPCIQNREIILLKQIQCKARRKTEQRRIESLKKRTASSIYRNKPKFQIMQERFELQRAIDKNNQIKSLQKISKRHPMNFRTLNTHEENYLKNLRDRSVYLKQKIEQQQKLDLEFKKSLNFYQSKSWEILQNEKKEQEENKQNELLEHERLRFKQKIYSQIISHNNRSYTRLKTRQSAIKTAEKPKKIHIYKISEIFKTKTRSNLRKNSSTPEIVKKVDYLAPFKSEKKDLSKLSVPCTNLSKIATKNDFTEDEVSEIRSEMTKNEKKARVYEHYIAKNKEQQNDRIRLNQEISNTYISSIKAKLAIFNSMN